MSNIFILRLSVIIRLYFRAIFAYDIIIKQLCVLNCVQETPFFPVTRSVKLEPSKIQFKLPVTVKLHTSYKEINERVQVQVRITYSSVMSW